MGQNYFHNPFARRIYRSPALGCNLLLIVRRLRHCLPDNQLELLFHRNLRFVGLHKSIRRPCMMRDSGSVKLD